MAIPLKYNIGNLMSRKVSALMTILGIGIVIAVMVAMLALYNGVQQALVSSGSKENLMVLREGAQAESTSWVTRDKYRIISALPGIEKAKGGDAQAGRTILERVWPPRKGARLQFDLPEVSSLADLPAAIGDVNRQVAQGDISPDEATMIVGLLEAFSAGYLSSSYKDAIAFLVILGVLFAMPQGLLGRAAVERV